jgi:hypothetical protein
MEMLFDPTEMPNLQLWLIDVDDPKKVRYEYIHTVRVDSPQKFLHKYTHTVRADPANVVKWLRILCCIATGSSEADLLNHDIKSRGF